MSAVQEQVEVGIWTRKLKALAIFACIFIILGAFIHKQEHESITREVK
jgi:hypothetical protein